MATSPHSMPARGFHNHTLPFIYLKFTGQRNKTAHALKSDADYLCHSFPLSQQICHQPPPLVADKKRNYLMFRFILRFLPRTQSAPKAAPRYSWRRRAAALVQQLEHAHQPVLSKARRKRREFPRCFAPGPCHQQKGGKGAQCGPAAPLC
jgi:hypothetical protein